MVPWNDLSTLERNKKNDILFKIYFQYENEQYLPFRFLIFISFF